MRMEKRYNKGKETKDPRKKKRQGHKKKKMIKEERGRTQGKGGRSPRRKDVKERQGKK